MCDEKCSDCRRCDEPPRCECCGTEENIELYNCECYLCEDCKGSDFCSDCPVEDDCEEK